LCSPYSSFSTSITNSLANGFDGLEVGEAGLCRIVQLALVRLLGNPSIMGVHAVSASAAWNLIESLVEDERVDFIPELLRVDSVLPNLLNYEIPTGKLVTDAYLAAFAITASRRLVTLDRGFRQFRGLDVDLLLRA
jgi:predicted nucleic acid-binding protein